MLNQKMDNYLKTQQSSNPDNTNFENTSKFIFKKTPVYKSKERSLWTLI